VVKDGRSGLEIRRASEAELSIAIAWAQNEGWNPGIHDASRFYRADPQGFFIGWLAGEPVATISAVRYGREYGFLGLYIVEPRMRGRGYGWQLWQAAMAHLGDRNVGLDGVVAQQHNYQKSGFAFHYRHVRYRGVARVGAEDARLVDLSRTDFEDVLAYDRRLFGADRRAFLHGWIDPPQGTALALRDGGGIAGYGVRRTCGEGHKIGPLYARDAATADALFRGLCAGVGAEPVFLDVPESNPAAVALARRHALTPIFETARMYTQGAPDTPAGETYGVTTLELG